MSQEWLNGHFVLLNTLCEICSRKLLELHIYKKLFSGLHFTLCLDTPSECFYSTGFLHWQLLCLLISIMGLNPLKIPSLESLAAFIKMQPKYLESSSSAQTGSAIYVCRVTSVSQAASHQEPEPARADMPQCQQQQRELSGWVRAFCSCDEPWPVGDMGVANSPAPGGKCCFSDQLWTPWQVVGEHFFRCHLITVMLILKRWGRTGRW